MNSPTPTSFAAVDFTGLARMKVDARTNPQAALRQAAQQFEALMLNQMMKSMRETVSDDGLFGSPEGKTFQGLLDQQWVSQISASRGLGIADMLVKQLGANLPGAGAATPGAALHDAAANTHPPALRQSTARQYLPQTADGLAGPADIAAGLGQSRAAFVQQLLPHAQRAAARLGVAPELIVAHAALETGWGRKPLGDGQGGDSFNLFGVKAGSRWNGRVAESLTTEYENGVPRRRSERFRAYEGYAQAFDDYAQLLSRERYAGVRNVGADSAAFASALQAAGYATDPNYARKLQQVASQLLSSL